MNKRQKEVLKSQLDDEKKIIKEIKSVYEQAIKDCDNKIRELSMRSDLENIQTIVYQKQYQEAIKGQLEGILEQLRTNEFATISSYLDTCYKSGYIGTMYDLQGQGIPLVMPINQEDIIQAINIDSKLSKSLYSKLGEDINKLKTSIRTEISIGIASGSNWNEVANKISRSMVTTPFNKAYNNAIRITRTEGHRVLIASTMKAQENAKENGADVVKQWDATLDEYTRESHQMLDGQIRELDENFEVGGASAPAPGHFGIAKEDINCRCSLLQRARWALGKKELETLQERAEYFGLDKTADFKEYKEKYLKITDKDAKLEIEKDVNHSETYKALKESLDKLGVEYKPVEKHNKQPTEQEIINAIAGGDRTSGSCASLGLAYIGQKDGLNVLDFRGGESQSFFSMKSNLEKIANFVSADSVKKSVAKSYITSGSRLLKEVEVGKEYYFVCGRHAAIVRKTDDGILQYLELQSSRQNGWTNFNGNPKYTLSNRFGCTNSSGRDVSGFMIDIDGFKSSEDLKSILGYINTSEYEQRKGDGGYAK